MRKVAIAVLAVAVVFGMSMGVMAGNEATIEQDVVDNSVAYIHQTGSNLEGTIIQGYAGEWGITQEGEGHTADILSTGYTGWNNPAVDSFVDQEGEDHTAVIDWANSHFTGGYSIVKVEQEGTNQYADVRVDNPDPDVEIYVDQLDEDNVANVDVHGTKDHFVDIVQDGYDNSALVSQRVTGEAEISQIGDENKAEIIQTD